MVGFYIYWMDRRRSNLNGFLDPPLTSNRRSFPLCSCQLAVTIIHLCVSFHSIIVAGQKNWEWKLVTEMWRGRWTINKKSRGEISSERADLVVVTGEVEAFFRKERTYCCLRGKHRGTFQQILLLLPPPRGKWAISENTQIDSFLYSGNFRKKHVNNGNWLAW